MTAVTSAADLRRRRRRILRWSSPVLVVAVVCGTKLVVMSGAAQVTRAAFAVGNEESAARAATIPRYANVVEQYKAPFNAGTVAAGAATDSAGLRGSVRLLREALRLATGEGECEVRVNLTLVLEASGTAAGANHVDAARLFAEANAVASAAPAGCEDVRSAADPAGPEDEGADETGDEAKDGEGAEGSRTAADDLADSAVRTQAEGDAALADEAAEQAAADAAGGTPSDQAAPPGSDRDAALAQRVADAQAQNTEVGDRRSAGDKGSGGTGSPTVPTPW